MDHGISISNGANLSQLELSEMHCISYATAEHETRTNLCLEAEKFSLNRTLLFKGKINLKLSIVVLN